MDTQLDANPNPVARRDAPARRPEPLVAGGETTEASCRSYVGHLSADPLVMPRP